MILSDRCAAKPVEGGASCDRVSPRKDDQESVDEFSCDGVVRLGGVFDAQWPGRAKSTPPTPVAKINAKFVAPNIPVSDEQVDSKARSLGQSRYPLIPLGDKRLQEETNLTLLLFAGPRAPLQQVR